MNKLSWFGCYDGSWQSAPLIAESYSHPAKISFNLAERIYRHMLAEGWLTPGAQVVDPFGGIGGLAFHAALYGMHWTGVELEPKFVELAQQNLDLWAARYGPHFPGYGTARILQGDSRHLAALVGGADGAVSSPPFQSSLQNSKDRSGLTFGNARYGHKDTVTDMIPESYGSTPGNLGNLPAGSYDGAVSSPPFGTGDSASGQSLTGRTDKSAQWIKQNTGWSTGYGSTPGQLGALPAGDYDAAISS